MSGWAITTEGRRTLAGFGVILWALLLLHNEEVSVAELSLGSIVVTLVAIAVTLGATFLPSAE